MRAVLCRAFGSPSSLEIAEILPPKMIEGGVRIAIKAAGINFADTVMIRGSYQRKLSMPFSPGLEAAGEVIECADGVTRCKPGDRVVGFFESGGYAEEVVVPEADVWQIPDGMDWVTAAGFCVVYGTADLALTDRGRLQAGETLLVTGAAGGVGLTAIEVGKRLGATVIAAAGGPDKVAVARAQGADHGIDYAREDLRERVKELTGGRGADVVFDPVGGDVFDAAFRCVAWGSRMLIIGFAAGRFQQIPGNILLVKNVSACGFQWGTYRRQRPDLMAESIDRIFSWWREGAVKPHVSMTFDLSEVHAALDALLTRRSTGKIVLTTGC